MQRVKRKAAEPKKIPAAAVEKKKENPGEKQAVPEAEKKPPVGSPGNPATGQMVMKAIETLNDKNGVSLQAIKKFILENNDDVSMKRQAPLIRRALKKAVDSGAIVHTKGKGASGSFKLASPGSSPVAAQKKSPTDKTTVATKKTAATTKKKATLVKRTSAPLKVKPTKARRTATPADKVEELEDEEMVADEPEEETKDEKAAVEESDVKGPAKMQAGKAKPTKAVKPTPKQAKK